MVPVKRRNNCWLEKIGKTGTFFELLLLLGDKGKLQIYTGCPVNLETYLQGDIVETNKKLYERQGSKMQPCGDTGGNRKFEVNVKKIL